MLVSLCLGVDLGVKNEVSFENSDFEKRTTADTKVSRQFVILKRSAVWGLKVFINAIHKWYIVAKRSSP